MSYTVYEKKLICDGGYYCHLAIVQPLYYSLYCHIEWYSPPNRHSIDDNKDNLVILFRWQLGHFVTYKGHGWYCGLSVLDADWCYYGVLAVFYRVIGGWCHFRPNASCPKTHQSVHYSGHLSLIVTYKWQIEWRWWYADGILSIQSASNQHPISHQHTQQPNTIKNNDQCGGGNTIPNYAYYVALISLHTCAGLPPHNFRYSESEEAVLPGCSQTAPQMFTNRRQSVTTPTYRGGRVRLLPLGSGRVRPQGWQGATGGVAVCHLSP